MMKNKLSKRVADIIATATPKQKAILISLENSDAIGGNRKPTISYEEAKAISESVKGNLEIREFNKWLGYYNVFAEFATIFGLGYSEYVSKAQEVIGYLRLWESYKAEENHLNLILEDLKEYKPDAVQTYRESLSIVNFKFAKLELGKSGYYKVNVSKLTNIINGEIKELKERYSILKAIIIVIEDWAKAKRNKAIMPPTIIEGINDAKSDYSLLVAPQYSRKILKEREERGETIPLEERKKALFPYYDEIMPDPEFLGDMRHRIIMYEKHYIH